MVYPIIMNGRNYRERMLLRNYLYRERMLLFSWSLGGLGPNYSHFPAFKKGKLCCFIVWANGGGVEDKQKIRVVPLSHPSLAPWNIAGRFLSHCTMSLSNRLLVSTASNIGLPKKLGEDLNSHIASLGHGFCDCFSCKKNNQDLHQFWILC